MIAEDTFFTIVIIYFITSPLVIRHMWKNNESVSVGDLLIGIILAPIMFLPIVFMWVNDLQLKKPTAQPKVTKPHKRKNTTSFMVSPEYLKDLEKELDKHK